MLNNSTPAERLRGCVFAETFETEAKATDNGCNVFGTPSFDFGVELDGISDYLSFNLQAHELDFPNISIVVRFTPDFDTDENATRYLFDSSSPRFHLYKSDNSTSNVFILRMGDTVVQVIAESVIAPYWLVGEENILVLSAVSGNTNMWLNGNKILNADVTSWNRGRTTTLFVGSAFNGGGKFDGKIHEVKIFQRTLTDLEAEQICCSTIYDYENRATAIYRMDAASHDAGNSRTLDSSGNGNHLPIEGATKIDGKGYRFTTDDYLEDADGFLGDGITSLTVCAMFRPTNNIANQTVVSCYPDGILIQSDTTDNAGYLVLGGSGLDFGRITEGARQSGVATICLSYDGSRSTNAGRLVAYWNGEKADITFNGAAVVPDELDMLNVAFSIGRNATAGRYWEGDILEVMVIEETLSNLQVADWHINALQRVNQN